ncbi:DUF916 and DUF3324 domain-containing protein [Furfurilactobacillus siliginis]|uniref:Cell surface protein n=1 Tax=Furfurilactobacillus siliginis TaxID=348151 RepID=A0A0R2L3Z0_9LACO|nr:DUF916 and DUF3324 domain-containing protein [Furfurilactobacillus siliginis]KRN96366.1 cell surface protein [Furfurilactobacillus siliginis]GEK29219.1 cell surface protein [Furfurilactobacillus siliginis]
MRQSFFRHSLWFLASLFGILLAGTQLVLAANTPDSGSGFTVQAVLPDNQLPGQSSFFNVHVQPNTAQALTVRVINLTNHARTLTVTPTDAWTGDNGQVSYSPNRARQPRTQLRFTKLTTPGVTVDLAAHEGKPVTFTAAIPTKPFAGQILGGIYVSDPKTTAGTKNGNFKINNHYAMAIAVNLQEKPTLTVKPALALTHVTASAAQQQPTLLATITNKQPILFGKLTLTATVFPRHSHRQIAKATSHNYAVAPVSMFDYHVPLHKRLAPGHYHMHLIGKSGSHTWQLDRPFTISRQAAAEVNHVNTHHNWTWLYISLGALVAAVLVIAGYLLGKRRFSTK